MKYILFILLYLSTTLVNSVDIKTYIPKKSKLYIKYINYEVKRLLPDMNYPEYFPGLIEHESCIYLTHTRCWDPSSKFKTKRELGVGLGQLTKAYKKDGSVRFDKLDELKTKHPVELKGINWDSIEDRHDLQIKAIILLFKDNYKKLYNVPDVYQRLAMSDAAYNGGLSGVFKDIRFCRYSKGCDYNKWFGNVELYCSKSKKILYGKRSACDINRNHVHDVLKIRMKKYEFIMDILNSPVNFYLTNKEKLK